MKKRVLLFALESINNVGEELLRQTTEYLIRDVSEDSVVSVAQLMPGRKIVRGSFRIDYLMGLPFLKCSSFLRGNFLFKVKNIGYRIAYTRYYKSLIKNTDKIVLAVGMMKYATQNFSYVFYLINRLASMYHKDVMMSAMSPQKGDDNDWRCRQLKKAVKFPFVKCITTRDGVSGVERIRSDYGVACDYVGDPALWIPQAFNIEPHRKSSSVPYIGINIIRKGIFKDYNRSLTDEKLFQIYVGVIKKIEEKGWRWSVFCNGMASDGLVLRNLQSELGFSDQHVMTNFNDGKSYAQMVSGFDVVFGARLHSCITSVAVSVPVVGFIWEDKLKYFSETMGISAYFFNPAEMTVEKILFAIEQALRFDYDVKRIDTYKERTLLSLRNFLNNN